MKQFLAWGQEFRNNTIRKNQKYEESLCKILDAIKWLNGHIIGFLKAKEKKKYFEDMLNEITAENPHVLEEICTETRISKNPKQAQPRRSSARYIVIK